MTWFKESKQIDFKNLQASQDENSNDLILNPFKFKLHNGNYRCEVILNDKQTIQSKTYNVDVKCNKYA